MSLKRFAIITSTPDDDDLHSDIQCHALENLMHNLWGNNVVVEIRDSVTFLNATTSAPSFTGGSVSGADAVLVVGLSVPDASLLSALASFQTQHVAQTGRSMPLYLVGVGGGPLLLDMRNPLPFPDLTPLALFDCIVVTDKPYGPFNTALVAAFAPIKEARQPHVICAPDLAWTLFSPRLLKGVKGIKEHRNSGNRQKVPNRPESPDTRPATDNLSLNDADDGDTTESSEWTSLALPFTEPLRRLGLQWCVPFYRSPANDVLLRVGLFISATSKIPVREWAKFIDKLAWARYGTARRTRGLVYSLELVPLHPADCDMIDAVIAELLAINMNITVATLKRNRDGGRNTRYTYSGPAPHPNGNVNVHALPSDVCNLPPFFRTFDYTVCTHRTSHLISLIAGVPPLLFLNDHDGSLANVKDGEHTENAKHTDNVTPSLTAREMLFNFETLRDDRDLVIRFITECSSAKRQGATRLYTVLGNLLFYLPQKELPFVDLAVQKTRKLAWRLLKLAGNQTTDPAVVRQLGYSPGQIGKLFTDWRSGRELSTWQENYVGKEEENEEIGEEIVTEIGEEIGEENDQYPSKIDAPSKSLIVQLVSYVLTGDASSKYCYGLSEQIFLPAFSLFESCKYILEAEQSVSPAFLFPSERAENLIPFQDRILNLEHMVQNVMRGYHRSGWAFVMQHLAPLHSPTAPIFDAYLDETFGWKADLLSLVGKLPYTRPWMGVLHHTPDTSFSDNNLVNVFARPEWHRSLEHCRGLIVFSSHLATWVRARLVDLGHAHRIRVEVLRHPTELVDPSLQFTMARYHANPTPKVIQIGAWLRNTYAIFEFPRVSGWQKCAMKGRAMEHYFISEDQFEGFMFKLRAFWKAAAGELDTEPGQCSGIVVPFLARDDGSKKNNNTNTSQKAKKTETYEKRNIYTRTPGLRDIGFKNTTKDVSDDDKDDEASEGYNVNDVAEFAQINKYLTGLWNTVNTRARANHQSVRILDYPSNAEYDTFLTQNVVFINLVDASAVNTILECIVRHTPILVNPLPAVVEYLGPLYPLYYNTLAQAAEKLATPSIIQDTHHYLRTLDKTVLSVKHFIQTIHSFVRATERDVQIKDFM